MKLESIETLLTTVCEYNTVRITQVFTRGPIDWISVRCIPSTSTLELTYLQEQKIELHDSVKEAAETILRQIQPAIPNKTIEGKSQALPF
ncbi:hypothetical protein [Planococcus chinensis]|uniref:DUF1652 domain-containing protein n=1 Tax=Planococcus chinensis TaxID=272917 RepID=A0ABW4QIU5_9BACL